MKAKRTTQSGEIPAAAGQDSAPAQAGAGVSNSQQAAAVSETAGGGLAATVGSWLPAGLQEAWMGTIGPSSPCEAELGQAETWYGQGKRGPISHQPSTGMGGFDASWTPSAAGAGLEKILMNVKIDFKDVLTMSGNIASPTDAVFQSAADFVNSLPPADRMTFAAEYMWDRASKAQWCTDLDQVIDSGWSGKHSFFINKPQWDWIGADVDVDLDVTEGTRGGHDHLVLDVYKVPEGEAMSNYIDGSSVSWGNQTDPMDQTGIFASTDLTAREDEVLEADPVFFANNSSQLDRTARDHLDGFVRTFEGAPGSAASQAPDVSLEGYASASGAADYNQQLSEQRTESVATYLRQHGFSNVATRVTSSGKGEDEAWAEDPNNSYDRRVEMEVDGGADQILAVHEFGHAFGLDDEYATGDKNGNPSWISGTGNDAGTQVEHDAVTQQMTNASGDHLPGAVSENNDNVMSFGNEILPQHYSTFWEALRTATGVSEWSVGPRKTKASVEQKCTTGPTGTGTP